MLIESNEKLITILSNDFGYYVDNGNRSLRNEHPITAFEALEEDIEDESITYQEYQAVVIELYKRGKC